MNLEPTSSSSSYEDDSSSSEEETDSPVLKASLPVTTANSSSSEEEEETDSESETEPVHDSKDGSKPKITANSLSDSPVVKPPADSSNKVEAPMNTANSSSEEEETDSESETEQEEVEAVKPPPDSSSKVPVNSSSEEEEEETDSESETDPVETSSKLETTEVEPDSPAVKPPTDSNKVETSQNPFVTKKRPIDETMDDGEAKRIKPVSGGDDDDKKITVFQETKKNYFQRVWTEEDEITVLQGIIDYQNETGANPFDDKNALYELLKQSISFNVTKTQFSEKIRSLKKKFDNNREKEKKRGEAPAFSKPHDLETFRLSKFVWGGDGIMSNAIEVKPPVLKLVAPAAVKKQEFVSIVEPLARFGVDDLFAKKGWSKLSLEDKKRLEVEWEALQLEELRFYARKSRFIHDAVTKMAEASKQDN